MLPKMVFALVAVNFSWAACVFLVDVSNVATTAVLAVPQSLREKHTGDYAETIFTNCTKDPNVNKNTNNEDNGVKFCAPKMLDFLKKNGLADADGKMKNTVTIKEIASAIEGLDEMDF